MNTLNIAKLGPTARLPLMEGTRLAWAESLIDNDSYYSMSMLLSGLADRATHLPPYIRGRFASERSRAKDLEDEVDDEEYVEVDENAAGAISTDDVGNNSDYATRTEKYLRVAMDKDWYKFVVYLAIPRQMLESIVLGTVAWDYHPDRGGRARNEYTQRSGMGIYVIGLSVKDRGGAWLTARELQSLVSDLKTYLLAYDSWSVDEEWEVGSDRALGLREFVTDIDDQYGLHRGDGPRFVTSAAEREGMQDLVRGLERRLEGSLRHDPEGSAPLIQSPLYVGLATELSEVVEAHKTHAGVNRTVKNSNKAYALIVSLMKKKGDTPPESTCRCVVRVWRKKDLWFAETLVSSLAGSLICHDGLNRTECGDPVKSDKPDYDKDGEEYVKVRSKFLYDNLVAALSDLGKRVKFVEELDALQPLVTDDLPGLLSLEAQCDTLRYQMLELQMFDKDLDRMIEEQERINAKLEAELEFLTIFENAVKL